MKRTEEKVMLERRSFLKISLLAGGGVMLGLATENPAAAQGRGAPAPPIVLPAHNADQPWNLADARGSSVVLAFFPFAFTAV